MKFAHNLGLVLKNKNKKRCKRAGEHPTEVSYQSTEPATV